MPVQACNGNTLPLCKVYCLPCNEVVDVYFPLHMSLCTNYILGVITIFGRIRRDVLVGRVYLIRTGGGGQIFRTYPKAHSLLCGGYRGS
jgi:hypothetical protein